MSSGVKISDLTAASTFTGSEVFPLVQNGTTLKGTADQMIAYVATTTVTFIHKTIDVAANTVTYSTATTNDIIYRSSGGTLSSYAPEETVTWYDGITSLYMSLPTVYAQRFVNSSKAPNGAVVSEVFQYLTQPYNQHATYGGTSLGYEPVDDGYRALYSNTYAVISKNPLRIGSTPSIPGVNTLNYLDLGPEIFWQRLVPNTGNNSFLAAQTFSASTPQLEYVFTTNAVASSIGTGTITITLNNHGQSVGNYVYFPSAITVGGLTFGGTSDVYNANNNSYGSYYVQSTPTANTFTITVSGAAASSATAGNGKSIRYVAAGTMPSNPFTFVSGSATVTVNHTNHNMVAGNYVFYSGASAAAGVTVAGNHQVVTVVDANTYTITLNSIQDGSSTASSSTSGGGASVLYSCSSGSINLAAVNFGAQIVNGNPSNPSARFGLGLGSPPNLNGGNDRQWFWEKNKFYWAGASTTAPFQLSIGPTDTYVRFTDVANTATWIAYNSSNANLALGYDSVTGANTTGQLVIAAAGGITARTTLTLNASLGFDSKTISTSAGTGSLTLGMGDAWTAYTPTITSGTGSFTSVSAAGRYVTVGKMCHFTVTITDTTNGTAASYINLPLPNGLKPKIDCYFGGINGSTGKGVAGKGYASNNTATLFDAGAGTFPIASGQTVTVSGVFETE